MQPSIVFILGKHRYLFKDLFRNLALEFQNNGQKVAFLLNKDFSEQNNELEFWNQFGPVTQVGQAIFQCKGGLIKEIRGLIQLKKELKAFFGNRGTCTIITPNAYELCVKYIVAKRPDDKVIYLQHSNIKRFKKRHSKRQKLYKNIAKVIIGIDLFSGTPFPPFGYKSINYVLWADVWASESNGEYKISFIPKPNQNRVPTKSIGKVNKVLIPLNKTVAMGLSAWITYVKFYLKFEEQFAGEVFFKPHPAEDQTFINLYLPGKKLAPTQVDFNDFDLVLSHWSTINYKVLLEGLPLIMVNPNGQFDFDIYRFNSYRFICSETEQIFELIEGEDFHHKLSEASENLLNSHLGKEGATYATLMKHILN